jgi:hypothetical protein
VHSPDHPRHPCFPRTRRREMLTFGVGALALLAVVVPACSSGNSTSATTSTATSGSSSSASTTDGSSSSAQAAAPTIDPCSVLTDAVAAKVYGAGATVTTSPSGPTVCSVSVMGLSYDLNVTVGSASDYQIQKSVAFENPTDFPGLGKEAVIGKSSDSTGAEPGLLYRTDGGMVYISGESDQAKLTALAGALAAQS